MGYIKDNPKEFGGIASIVLTHGACFISGAYKGAMNQKNIEVEVPFKYLWGSNIVGTGIANPLFEVDKGEKDNPFSDEWNSITGRIVKGAALGTIAAPIEYIIGYGMGYAGGWIIDTVF